VFVAHEAGAKRLALYHHDPAHDDDAVDGLLEHARGVAETTSLSEVIAAYEGLTVSFGG
jgi:ribonuclease BN (tRNA processing enzyme)